MTENKRIIKFRAWDKAHNKMSYQVNLYAMNRAGEIDKAQLDLQQAMKTIGLHCEVMQFTGLPDKNGKEIYEGDIIRGKNGKLWVIEWKDYGWCINNHLIADPKAKFAGPETYGFAYWMQLHPEGHCDVEIIGSLYENPELIKS